MKIRKGFVSNSSTGSFIVQIEKDSFREDESWIATEQQVNQLVEYGFKPSSLFSPYHCSCRENENKKDQKYMKFFVICNEDIVIDFLLKNKIPFKASCHYDHQYYAYKRGNDFMWYGYNYGQYMNLYGEEHGDMVEKMWQEAGGKSGENEGNTKILLKEWFRKKK